MDRGFALAKSIDHLSELTKKLATMGLETPIWVCINKISGRAYVHDGNHRIAACKRLTIEWIPVYMTYKSQYIDGKEFRFPSLPKVFSDGQWPKTPTPEVFGFKTRELCTNMNLGFQNIS